MSRTTREDAIKILKFAKEEIRWHYSADYTAAIDMAIAALQEPERKHGTWIYDVPLQDGEDRGDFDLTCSVCGKLQCCYTKEDSAEFKKYNLFCPNCGAEMDGRDE